MPPLTLPDVENDLLIPEWVKNFNDLVQYLDLNFFQGRILQSMWCNISPRENIADDLVKATHRLQYCVKEVDRLEKRLLQTRMHGYELQATQENYEALVEMGCTPYDADTKAHESFETYVLINGTIAGNSHPAPFMDYQYVGIKEGVFVAKYYPEKEDESVSKAGGDISRDESPTPENTDAGSRQKKTTAKPSAKHSAKPTRPERRTKREDG